MTRHATLITFLAFAATFAWLLVPDRRNSAVVLWPSVLAVGLAFFTRDIHLSLLTGAFGGALLLHGGNPLAAFPDLFTARLLPALADRWNLCVLVFTLLMGGFVEVLHRNGGMAALTARVLGRMGDARRSGLGAYWLGWLVFFDGLANAMLIGKTLRPVADRAGLSREKLAFIVDSTSSPIAGLALLSTWVAYEMSVIREGFTGVDAGSALAATAPFPWLVLSLPFRFYNWFLLLLVFLVVWKGRDFGPMLAAERAARARHSAKTAGDAEGASPATPAKSIPQRASMLAALVPLAVLIAGVFAGLFLSGGGMKEPLTFDSAVRAFGAADAALVFVIVTALACVVAVALSPLSGVSLGAARDGLMHGMREMFLPTLILVLAWMLNSVIKELGAAKFLVSLLGGNVPSALMPALVFLLASAVSFSTGTSWGTMAIVMPLAIPLAAAGGAPAVMAATIGAVLAGAVFGDHCSPISDTTVVSAFSCDCEVMAHVRTQLPYALAAAGIAVALGYAPAGFGAPWWLLLPCGAAAVWALLRYAGKRAEDSPQGR